MWQQSLKFVSGVLLAPLAAVTMQSLVCLIADLAMTPGERGPLVSLGAGAVLAAVTRSMRRSPTRLEILVHELTHVLWTWLFGGRASHLRVGRHGGSVQVTHDNVWVSLSPYFFPLTTIALLVAWGLLRLFIGPAGPRWLWWALLGASWGAHTVTVTQLLGARQSDLEAHGRFFSLALILTANLFGAGLALALLGNDGVHTWLLRWMRNLALAIRMLIAFAGLG